MPWWEEGEHLELQVVVEGSQVPQGVGVEYRVLQVVVVGVECRVHQGVGVGVEYQVRQGEEVVGVEVEVQPLVPQGVEVEVEYRVLQGEVVVVVVEEGPHLAEETPLVSPSSSACLHSQQRKC